MINNFNANYFPFLFQYGQQFAKDFLTFYVVDLPISSFLSDFLDNNNLVYSFIPMDQKERYRQFIDILIRRFESYSKLDQFHFLNELISENIPYFMKKIYNNQKKLILPSGKNRNKFFELLSKKFSDELQRIRNSKQYDSLAFMLNFYEALPNKKLFNKKEQYISFLNIKNLYNGLLDDRSENESISSIIKKHSTLSNEIRDFFLQNEKSKCFLIGEAGIGKTLAIRKACVDLLKLNKKSILHVWINQQTFSLDDLVKVTFYDILTKRISIYSLNEFFKRFRAFDCDIIMDDIGYIMTYDIVSSQKNIKTNYQNYYKILPDSIIRHGLRMPETIFDLQGVIDYSLVRRCSNNKIMRVLHDIDDILQYRTLEQLSAPEEEYIQNFHVISLNNTHLKLNNRISFKFNTFISYQTDINDAKKDLLSTKMIFLDRFSNPLRRFFDDCFELVLNSNNYRSIIRLKQFYKIFHSDSDIYSLIKTILLIDKIKFKDINEKNLDDKEIEEYRHYLFYLQKIYHWTIKRDNNENHLTGETVSEEEKNEKEFLEELNQFTYNENRLLVYLLKTYLTDIHP